MRLLQETLTTLTGIPSPNSVDGDRLESMFTVAKELPNVHEEQLRNALLVTFGYKLSVQEFLETHPDASSPRAFLQQYLEANAQQVHEEEPHLFYLMSVLSAAAFSARVNQSYIEKLSLLSRRTRREIGEKFTWHQPKQSTLILEIDPEYPEEAFLHIQQSASSRLEVMRQIREEAHKFAQGEALTTLGPDHQPIEISLDRVETIFGVSWILAKGNSLMKRIFSNPDIEWQQINLYKILQHIMQSGEVPSYLDGIILFEDIFYSAVTSLFYDEEKLRTFMRNGQLPDMGIVKMSLTTFKDAIQSNICRN